MGQESVLLRLSELFLRKQGALVQGSFIRWCCSGTACHCPIVLRTEGWNEGVALQRLDLNKLCETLSRLGSSSSVSRSSAWPESELEQRQRDAESGVSVGICWVSVICAFSVNISDWSRRRLPFFKLNIDYSRQLQR